MDRRRVVGGRGGAGPLGRGTVALADACGGNARALRAFAVELRSAQQQYADAAQRAVDGRALVDGVGSGAPDTAGDQRDRGEAAVHVAGLAMDAARERARIANEAAARAVDAAATHLAGIAPPSAPSGTPPGFGAADVATALGNAGASAANAALHDPLSVGAVLAGGALTTVSAIGFAGGVVADATGAGAVVGLPLGGASAAGIAAGVGIAGAGIAGLVQHATTDRRVQPFQVNNEAASTDPGPGAPAAERVPNVGQPGKNEGIRELPDDEAVRDLFEELAEGGTPDEPSTYPGRVIRTSDGTIVRLREESVSGGPTIDATLPNNEQWKVHRPLWPK